MNDIAIRVITIIIATIIGFCFGAYSMKKHDSANMFCPECGRHYQDVVYCEYDGTELKEIQK
jgi:hypothetical protein